MESLLPGHELTRTSSPLQITQRSLAAVTLAAAELRHAINSREVFPRSVESANTIILRHCSALMNNSSISPVSILEVGCGSGALLPLLEATTSPCFTYTGVDLHPKPSWEQAPPGTFVQADAIEWLARSDEAFDITLSSSVLEHVQYDWTLLAQCVQHTKPGGMSIHIVPGTWGALAYPLHGRRHYTAPLLREIQHRAQSLGVVEMDVTAIGGPRSAMLQGLTRGLPSLIRPLRHVAHRSGSGRWERFLKTRDSQTRAGRGIFYCVVFKK